MFILGFFEFGLGGAHLGANNRWLFVQQRMDYNRAHVVLFIGILKLTLHILTLLQYIMIISLSGVYFVGSKCS